MKKIISLLFLFAAVNGFAQTAAKWQQIYGGPGNEYGYSVRSCPDQGYIVAGSTSSNGISDGYLVRTDSMGLVMWSKYFAGDNVDILRSIRLLPDSGYILAGYSNSTGTHGGYDGWVIRIDKNGDSLWSRFIGTPDWDFFYDVAPTWDGGFVLAGGTYGAGMGDEDMYFVKLDANGDTLWTKTCGGLKADEARGVIQTGDSLLAVCGFTYSLGDTLGDSWILRMNAMGDTLWSRTALYNTSADKAFGIADYPVYQRILIVGQTSVSGNPDALIDCITYTGAQVYEINFGLNPDDVFNQVVTRPNGDFGVIGTTHSYGGGNGDFWFFRSTGPWLFTTFGTVQADEGYSLDNTHDGGYIACGFTTGYNSILPNMLLVKIDTAGTSPLVLSVRERPNAISGVAVSVFPNPSSTEMFVSLDDIVPFQGKLQLEVFDLMGRKVLSIPAEQWQNNSDRSASVRLETSQLNEGCYQLRIGDGSGGKYSGKFIVVH